MFLLILCSSRSVCVWKRENGWLWYTRTRYKTGEHKRALEWELVVIGNSELDAFIYEHDCMKETLAFSCFWTTKPACVPLYASFLYSSSEFFFISHSIPEFSAHKSSLSSACYSSCEFSDKLKVNFYASTLCFKFWNEQKNLIKKQYVERGNY